MKSDFHEFVMRDLLGDVPGVTSRTMFGGYGIYERGIIFAIIADGRLYFKVDEESRSDYESAGSKPFTYVMHGKKPLAMSYWELPEEVMEDREELARWVTKAVRASAMRKKKSVR